MFCAFMLNLHKRTHFLHLVPPSALPPPYYIIMVKGLLYRILKIIAVSCYMKHTMFQPELDHHNLAQYLHYKTCARWLMPEVSMRCPRLSIRSFAHERAKSCWNVANDATVVVAKPLNQRLQQLTCCCGTHTCNPTLPHTHCAHIHTHTYTHTYTHTQRVP